MTVRLAVLLAIAVPAAAGAQPPATRGPASTKATGVSVKPGAGKEGTRVTITYPSALPAYPNALEARIVDPGVHGYHIVESGGVYVAYDGHRGSTYTVPAAAVAADPKKNAYEFTIPAGVCGIIIKPTQATVSNVPAGVIQGSPTVVGQNVTKYPRTASGGKTLQVSLVGQKGKPAKFSLTCDKYTLSVKVKADPTKVSPLPGSSTVTATLTVKGPAQVVVGARIQKPANPPMLLAPLAFETVLFDTTFGTLAPPAPAKVTTATDGTASVAVSSGEPGTATVRAVAMGIGDGRATVQFAQKVEEEKTVPVMAGPPPAKPAEPGLSKTPQQCAAETEQRHSDIVTSMKGKPTHEIAQALADGDATNASVAECAGRKSGGGGGDTTPAMTNASTGNPELDDAVAEANKSALEKEPETAPANHSKALIIGGGAAIGATLVAVAGSRGGTSSPSDTATGGGSTTPPPPPAFDPRTLNSPPPYKGDQVLQPTFTTHSVSSLCAGSDARFGETVTVNLNANGGGTITLDDTPGFERVYQVTVTALNQPVTSQGTFPFFGAPIPGTLSVTFSSTTQLTMRETTTFGSCSNTYAGSMSR